MLREQDEETTLPHSPIMSAFAICLAALLVTAIPRPVPAQTGGDPRLSSVQAADAELPQAYTLDGVIRMVLAGHPELAVSAYDPELAANEEDRLQASLSPTLDARLGFSDDEAPVSSDFQPEATRSLDASGGISVPLSGGATIDINANYSRTKQDFASPFAAQLARINPAYRGGLNVSYRLPLMRGAGRPDYEQGLVAARADTAAAGLQRLIGARRLGLEAMTAYFRILADETSVHLADVAVERARRLLAYQRLRERFGLIDAADRLQTEALLAERQLELQQAQARTLTDRVDLNRLMQRQAGAPLDLAPVLPADSSRPLPSLDSAFAAADQRRPEFPLIDARINAASARLNMARDAERRRVDVVAEAGTYSLDSAAADAVTGALDTNDRFIGLSLEFSELLHGGQAAAERRRAGLLHEQLLAQRRQTVFDIRNELATVLSDLANGEQTLQLARHRADTEKKKYEAQVKLYRDGRSDTATVVQFEGDLHRAELEAKLDELSLRLAERQLAWSTGTLFQELGIDIDALLARQP